MSFKANDYAGSNLPKIDPLEPGAYPARVVSIMNIGLQKQNAYQGKEKPPKHELSVTYELLDEFLKDEDGQDDLEKPRWVSETFPLHGLSSENAKSTLRYLALDPNNENDGDWSQLIGFPCIVNLVQSVSKKDKTRIYNNVDGVHRMRDKDAKNAPELVHDPVLFDLYNPDVKVFLALPTFLQNKIKESLDFEGSKLQEMLEDLSESETKPEKKENKPRKEQKKAVVDDEDEKDDWDDE